MWFGVVCALIDNDIRYDSGQKVFFFFFFFSGQKVASRESTTNFDHCDDEYRCR